MNTQATTETELVNFTIDGKAASAPKGTTVYKAARQNGIEIPIFCYHDRMPPFGACRVCLVEVEKMPKLQTSCTLEVAEGMVIRTQSQMAVEGREQILEFLLINHPLDCPICDRGGECPLQEHVFNHGPGLSRFFEDKRRFKKHLPLGPVLMLDRERCIVCARCTRFSDLVAGDHALEMKERSYKTEVGTPDNGPALSKFIGNTIMICPVGALTSQVYRFRARPWDNVPTKSTCTLCPVGCSLFFDSRDGEIMRTRSCESKEVNDIWLCDKGWFGYEFTQHQDRLQHPLIRREGTLVPATWEEALSLVADKMKEFKAEGKVAALGGNPLTVEENFYFQKLMRDGLQTNNIDHRVGMPIMSLEEEGMGAGMRMPVAACEDLSYAILLGIDLTEEFPVIWLRLHNAIKRGAKVIFIGHYAPEIERHLEKTILHAPGNELNTLQQQLPQWAAFGEGGKKGAFFVGRQYLDNPQRAMILSELEQACQRTPNLTLNILEGSGNSMGACFAGMRPDLGPFGQRLSQPGLNASELIEKAASQGWDFLYVAGANPARKYPSQQWQAMRSKLKFLVVQDLFLTKTAEQADVVLPALSFVEKGGSFMNIEGRVQPLLPGKMIPEAIYSDGEIFEKIGKKLGLSLYEDTSLSERLQTGEVVPLIQNKIEKPLKVDVSIASNGSLLATFATALFDNGVRMMHDPHTLELVKTPFARLNPHEGAKRRIVDGDIVRLTANGHSIEAQVKLEEGVSLGTIVLPLGFLDVPVQEFGVNVMNGLAIEIETGGSK